MPTVKNVTPRTVTEALKRSASQNAMKAWTTNPPPKESMANSPARRNTTGRDSPSARAGAVSVRRVVRPRP